MRACRRGRGGYRVRGVGRGRLSFRLRGSLGSSGRFMVREMGIGFGSVWCAVGWRGLEGCALLNLVWWGHRDGLWRMDGIGCGEWDVWVGYGAVGGGGGWCVALL